MSTTAAVPTSGGDRRGATAAAGVSGVCEHRPTVPPKLTAVLTHHCTAGVAGCAAPAGNGAQLPAHPPLPRAAADARTRCNPARGSTTPRRATILPPLYTTATPRSPPHRPRRRTGHRRVAALSRAPALDRARAAPVASSLARHRCRHRRRRRRHTGCIIIGPHPLPPPPPPPRVRHHWPAPAAPAAAVTLSHTSKSSSAGSVSFWPV